MAQLPGNTYQQRWAFQLQQWVEGNSLHNDLDGECCPDFSCCKPELRASAQERQAYYSADESQREAHLMRFLGGAIELASKKKVFITNGRDSHTANG